MTRPDDEAAKQAAEAIAVEASRLQRLALEHDLHFLAYLLEMALLEAWREACGEAPPGKEGRRVADLAALGLKGAG
jgi:hypothetical protein